MQKTTISGSRHSIKAIRNALNKNGYRKDLTDVCAHILMNIINVYIIRQGKPTVLTPCM